MKVNGESIYGTTASPFARMPFFGRATTKGNKLYLHVFEWPADGQLRVPGLKNLVHSAQLLADPARDSRRAATATTSWCRCPARRRTRSASVVCCVWTARPWPRRS